MAMVNRPIKNLDQIQVQESQHQMDQNQILKVQNRAPWLVDEIAQFLLVDIMSAKKPTARKNSSTYNYPKKIRPKSDASKKWHIFKNFVEPKMRHFLAR